MSTSAAKDPAITVGHIKLIECPNGDCVIEIDSFAGGHGVLVQMGCYPIHIPKAHRNAIAEFLKV
jgi:hypothetical protein